MKRLLNCTTSEMLAMNGEELKQSILACEGRTVMTETVVASTIIRRFNECGTCCFFW